MNHTGYGSHPADKVVQRAIDLKNRGRERAAIVTLERQHKRPSGLGPRGLWLLGLLYLAHENFRLGTTVLQELILRAPLDPASSRALFVALRGPGRLAEARDEARRYILAARRMRSPSANVASLAKRYAWVLRARSAKGFLERARTVEVWPSEPKASAP